MSQMTPMFRQYLGIKSEYPDALLFFRMGDFYEMFFEDAEIASKVLGIALTSRGSHNGQKVPMCGVPHHASKSYVAKLIENGLKVAICEQTEDPRNSKGIVQRDVVRIITPGSVLEEGTVDEKSNLYIAGISKGENQYGLAHADLSTGAFRVTEIREWREVLDELGRIGPAELLVLEKDLLHHRKDLSEYRLETLGKESFQEAGAEPLLKEQLGTTSLAGFGCDRMKEGIIAAGALVHYLLKTQKGNLIHIKEIVSYQLGEFMFLDESTVMNLELFETMRRRSLKGSLFYILDKTRTSMGSRTMKRWIAYPLRDLPLPPHSHPWSTRSGSQRFHLTVPRAETRCMPVYLPRSNDTG